MQTQVLTCPNKQAQKEDVKVPSIEHLYCSIGNQAILLCQNKFCSNNSFICSSSQCQCRNIHRKCLKTSVQEFLLQINKKIFSTTAIKQKVDLIIDEAIDYISNIRDEIYEDIRYLGLNQDEKQMMDLLATKQHEMITGSMVWKVSQGIYDQKNLSSSQILKEMDKYWEAHKKKVVGSFEKLKQISQRQSNVIQNLFTTSEIIKQISDVDKLTGFFTNQIIKTTLLYSAKRDKYNLKTYHQAVTGKKNSLILIKSLEGKIFGGYLNFSTGKGFNANNLLPQNKSSQSFVFSVSNNHKFNLKFQKPAYTFNSVEGPIFGQGFIGIYRKQFGVNPNIGVNALNRPLISGNPFNNTENLTDENRRIFGNGEGVERGAFRGRGGSVGRGGYAGRGGFVGGFGGGGLGGQLAGGFDHGLGQGLNDVPILTSQQQLTYHSCTVFRDQSYYNQNYSQNDQSKQKFTGNSQLMFKIKEWQAYQLEFQDI